jgi:SAM-dependent methyltransferase
MLSWLRPAFANRLKSAFKNVRDNRSKTLASCERRTPETDDERPHVDYEKKLAQELTTYHEVENVHNLPEIYHYWSNKFILPLCRESGFDSINEFFANNLHAAAVRGKHSTPQYISIGAGNCDLEIEIAKLLKVKGLTDFKLECLELNPRMLARGTRQAYSHGVVDQLIFTEGDFNTWKPNKIYTSVMANHSLHHVVNLEGLFDGIKSSLEPTGYFVANDMIGRNGHLRWPEALEMVRKFWEELPKSYRYNRQLKRHEQVYLDWDCSNEGFEGIRAQDILPLLIERFDFTMFFGFANVVAPFIDRSFGPNFDATADWDRDFVDRVHNVDEHAIVTGQLKPTQMMAVMAPERATSHLFVRGVSPDIAFRDPRG